MWNYFLDLNSRRSGTGYGPQPISYSEILAYFQLYGISYEPVEITLIALMDNKVMQIYNEKIEKDTQKNSKK